MLYALDVARIAMRERSRAIIVEGYLDCLMAHQHGFGETVAALWHRVPRRPSSACCAATPTRWWRSSMPTRPAEGLDAPRGDDERP